MFIALVATSVAGANAQKFQGGEKNLEVNFSPLSENPVAIDGIRFRMFNSESSAIRVGFSISGQKDVSVYSPQFVDYGGGSNGSDVTIPDLLETNRSFGFSIRPGYEKHFAGTDRLSPYVGAELAFSMERSTLTREFHDGNTAESDAAPEQRQVWDMTVTTGSSTLGLNALAGFDFYFTDNLYLGAEISLGLNRKSYRDRETEASNPDNYKFSAEAKGDIDFWQAQMNQAGTSIEYQTITGSGNPEDVIVDPTTGVLFSYKSTTKSSSWGPTVQSTLRIGWLF